MKFNNFEFGNFDEFNEFENISLNELNDINLTEVAKFMSYTCDELFEKICWWRNREIPCCEIFSIQKTEYGFCYSFNSLTNDEGRKKAVRYIYYIIYQFHMYNVYILKINLDITICCMYICTLYRKMIQHGHGEHQLQVNGVD